MSRKYPPFTIHEAEYRMYLTDSQGEILGESVYLGGCLENLEINSEYESIALNPHGARYGRKYHVDETHNLRIENLWCMTPATNEMPRMRHRNQDYILSVRWHDREKGIWCKLVFRGVKSSGQRIYSGEAFSQDLIFTASSVDEPESGLAQPPDFPPTPAGVVRYVTASEDLPIYRYNFATGDYSALSLGLLVGRAAILAGVDDFKIQFNSVDALVIYPRQNFTLTVAVPATSWVAVHNLNAAPLVYIFDDLGNALFGAIHRDSANQITVSHLEAMAGEVICKKPSLVFTQSSPLDTWFISHGFGESPEVQVVDSLGDYVAANITHPTADTTQIEFFEPMAGTAVLLRSPGLFVKEVTAIGGAFPLGAAYPRLEFWRGSQRVGSLTAAGELCVPELDEVVDAPVDPDDFEFRINNVWQGGISYGKTRAFSFNDNL